MNSCLAHLGQVETLLIAPQVRRGHILHRYGQPPSSVEFEKVQDDQRVERLGRKRTHAPSELILVRCKIHANPWQTESAEPQTVKEMVT
jgi:hypothetical protein